MSSFNYFLAYRAFKVSWFCSHGCAPQKPDAGAQGVLRKSEEQWLATLNFNSILTETKRKDPMQGGTGTASYLK